ncbi:PREDICTED: odorant receptor Or1-like [Dinoponera quadriceps]|uniref:Odorant receptor n=1 Tax=Dinoponera quadriceps TaxID=609295 RepID=A0A6P3Y1N9_DINQU|nr:PREDICTED: odorant receptor Or1-like [Dinoponera quadriceps]
MPRRTAGGCLDNFRKLSTLHTTYLKYVGLWAPDSHSSALSRCMYFVYNKAILTIMFLFSITLFADICSSFDDLSIVTDDGCVFAGITVVLFKVMIFQFRREKIARLLRETINSCRRLCEFPTGDEDEILAKYLLICRASFYGFGTLGFFLVVALLFLAPVEEGGLPIRARYPFDTSSQPGHGVGYFVEACSVSVGITAIIGIDSLLTNLSNLFLVQLKILNVHFRKCGGRHDARDHLGGDSRSAISPTAGFGKDNYDPDAIHGGGFAVRLRRSVRGHQRLLAIMDDFNEVFSAGMFVQMLSSTSMICLTGFQATLVIGHSSNTCKFAIYLAAALSQLFYFCLIGNEVIHQSACLTQSQWLSEWDEKLTAKTGRLLILSMLFSRRTLNLKAGVFYSLSMETFTAIIRGSYSFFALLNTIQSEGDQ